MTLYTQIFNITTALDAKGVVTLGLSFTSNFAGSTVDAPNEYPTTTPSSTTAFTPIVLGGTVAVPLPTYDSYGSAITLANISADMAGMPPDANYMDFALAITSQDLDAIGKATSYKVGTATFTDLGAAKDALLAPIDQLGGRSYIDGLIVDNRTFDGSKVATTTGTAVNDMTTEISHASSELIAGLAGFNTDLAPQQAVGLLKIAGTLSMDPLINLSTSVLTGDIPGLDNGSKVWTAVGVQSFDVLGGGLVGVDQPAGNLGGIGEIVVNMPSQSPGTFGQFPVDGATLNLLGSLNPDRTPAITINVESLGTGKIALNLAQIDTITSNENVAFHLVNMSDVASPVSFGDVFRIRDSAANIALMTPEQASNLQSLNQSFVSFESPTPGGGAGPSDNGPAPRPIEITPTDPATVINLAFATASALANSGFMLANIANVKTALVGAFGLVTGDDLARLAQAGVDSVAFDTVAGVTTTLTTNGTTTAFTTAPTAPLGAGVTFTPFVPGSRQLIIEQQDVQAISKISLTGLANNNTIDVVVNVDDSQGSVQLPTAIVSRLGIDRITAQDGNLDIGFMDARNAMKSKVAFGNIGDNSDVTLHINQSKDLMALKASMVGSFASNGVDVIAYDAASAATYDKNTGDLLSTGVNFEMSASNSKNFIDMVAAATRANIAVDFSSLVQNAEDYDLMSNDIKGHVVLAASALTMPGSAANFVTTVNAFGDQGLYIGRPNMVYDNGQHRFVQNGDIAIEVSSSGLAISSVEVTDFRTSEIESGASIGSLVKSIAKATGAGMTLVDFYTGFNDGASEKYGLFEDVQTRGYADNASDLTATMAFMSKSVMGVSNLYADFRISDLEAYADMGLSVDYTGDAGMETAVLTNLSKFTNGGALISGFKGIVVDDHVLNDFWTMADRIETASADTSTSHIWSGGSALDALNANGDANNVLDLSLAAQSLDVVYSLDASDLSSSVGLSKYVIGTDGTGLGDLFTNDSGDVHFGFYLKDAVSTFRSNANTIDKIVVSNASAGDMSIDLSEFGLGQTNFDQKIRWVTGKEDQFILDANNGKKIAIQILGLTDHTQFTSADIRELPQHGDLTIIG